MTKLIRNSTAEFLIFTSQAGEDSIEVRVENETVWLTQKMMAQLFDVQVPAIIKHIANILAEAELTEATTSKMEVVQQEVERTVRHPISHKPSHQLSWSH